MLLFLSNYILLTNNVVVATIVTYETNCKLILEKYSDDKKHTAARRILTL